MTTGIIFKRADSLMELRQILTIQQRNTKSKLSREEIASQGFITVVHHLDLLKSMNQACAHIIAKKGPEVAGYALCMQPSFQSQVPVLAPLFTLTDKLLADRNYLVMGQICIDRPYRGRGLFRGMYSFYQQELSRQYECLVTEVALDNPRSLYAHKSVGFETIHRRQKDGVTWELLVWEWTGH